MARAKPPAPVPPCKGGSNPHVFTLGADACSLCGWNRYPKKQPKSTLRYVDLGEWTLKHPRTGEPATVRGMMTVDLDKMNALVGKARRTGKTTLGAGGITISVTPAVKIKLPRLAPHDDGGYPC